MEQLDELTIALSKPITLGSEVYTEVMLREPTAGEVERAQRAARGPDGSGTASDIVLVSLVSGIPKPAVERIPFREFQRAVQFLGGFLTAGPATGTTSSPR